MPVTIANKQPERAHHPYSPSTLAPREACACYQPEQGDSEASRAGTAQHSAVESGRLDGLDDAQAEAVEKCLSYYGSILEQMQGDDPEGLVEIQEEYLAVDDEETTAGWVDKVILSQDRRTCHVFDWKFGKHSVEPAETNPQMISYVLGLARKFPTIETAFVHIVCPYQNVIDVASFVSSQFPEMLLRIRTIVARAKDPTSQPTPSTSACLFCARKGTCQALHAHALKIAAKFAPMQVPENISPMLINDPAHAGEVLKVAQIAAAWAKAVRTEITKKALEEGRIPDGYRLEQHTKRTVADYSTLRRSALSFGLTEAEVDAASDAALGKLEDAVSAKAKRGFKAIKVQEFSDAIREAGAVEDSEPIISLRQIKGGAE